MSRTRKLISLFILALAALHVVPIVQEIRAAHQTAWPVKAWGMYRNAHSSPVEVTRFEVFVATADGMLHAVRPEDVGLAPRTLFSGPASPEDSIATRRLITIESRRLEARVEALIARRARFRIIGTSFSSDTTTIRIPVPAEVGT